MQDGTSECPHFESIPITELSSSQAMGDNNEMAEAVQAHTDEIVKILQQYDKDNDASPDLLEKLRG